MALDDLPTYVLKNAQGVEVHIRALGALIQKLILPDKHGCRSDVVLGFDSLGPYEDGTSPYFGVVVGRVANRIENSRFTLGDRECQVVANENGHCLHGGKKGWDKKVWTVSSHRPVGPSADGSCSTGSVTLELRSEDGDQGFPGDVHAVVEYTLSDGDDCDGILTVAMSAKSSHPTPISTAQHSYFNLSGHDSGRSVLGHQIHINADAYTPVTADLIPTGEITPVQGTAFDFRESGASSRRIGDRIADVPGGYDHNFVLNKVQPSCTPDTVDSAEGAALHLAAVVMDSESGRKMELSTSAPGMQLYTGNFLDGSIRAAKDGATYEKHGGFCLETQRFPNAVNQPAFASPVLLPGQSYVHVMRYKFSK
eukprot:CAMPEP_0198235658 /NCGR_PEP_ID=MMETSP1446-20131203/1539_1 /TAXON_ID=1461542 ORGANISM="Unidentified sp, Strain CCMP2111" /NCGR_SAMPLE_ID=MMETSP1446 /ASSEMBLY_ACC=CAM_ASM_001112 /LENGTH=366 /DNA_ID=CAMNT_0043916953 /DNA_START=31 /DNA_END=1131 /DNA_ORIENTATION=-